MKINDFDISNKVFVIAEIGNNHEGDFTLANDMIKMAADAGVDAVKFQTFSVNRYVTSSDKKRFEQLKKFELTYEQFESLSQTAKDNQITFLSTPFDIESVDAIEPFVSAYKIASGDNTFWPLLKHVAKKGKPIILSTGIATISDLEKALSVITTNYPYANPKDAIALLHCISAYPASDNDLNLLSIKYLKDYFGCLTGYSDHSLGITSCIAAVALGARIIEKHFTYKKEGQSFRDHLLSATPNELKEMVEQIRSVEQMLGSYKKGTIKSEEPLYVAARRSIASKKDLLSGSIIQHDDITWVRPGNGIKPGNEDQVIGHILKDSIPQGHIFSQEDFV